MNTVGVQDRGEELNLRFKTQTPGSSKLATQTPTLAQKYQTPIIYLQTDYIVKQYTLTIRVVENVQLQSGFGHKLASNYKLLNSIGVDWGMRLEGKTIITYHQTDIMMYYK